MITYTKLKHFILDVDENTDYNNYNSVVTAIENLKTRIMIIGITVLLLGIVLGYLTDFSLGMILVIVIWLPFVFIGNSSFYSLSKAKGLDCKSCGRSLIIPLSQGKTYYQCKNCGAKPGQQLPN